MKRLLPLAVLFVLASCGSDVIVGAGSESTPVGAEPTTVAVASPPPITPVTTPTPAPPPATQVPDDDVVDDEVAAAARQRKLLVSARARWQANRPTSYSFRYTLQCECDQGPWEVFVDVDGTSTATLVFDEPGGADAPYLSVDAIFDEIEATLDTGRFPVKVEYDPDLGLPREYIFNGPELAVDGGFVLVVDEFTADPATERDADRQALEATIERWQQAAISGYDFTFQRVCFCPVEFTGPFEASVQNGEVIAATLDGVDLFDIATIDVNAYGERVLTVEAVFAEIGRAINEAASYTVEYDPELGFPSNVFIDWAVNIADEEDGYVLTELVAR